MIWRGKYKDQILENIDLPALRVYRISDAARVELSASGIVIGCFSQAGAGELGMWRKLVETTLGRDPDALWIGVDREFIASAVPRSLQEHSYVTQDRAWQKAVGQSDQTSFAIFSKEGGQNLVFLGLPTEEGLDRITHFVEAPFNSPSSE